MKNPYEAYILIEVFCIAFALYNLFRLKKGYNIGKEKPILTKIIICFLVLVCTDIIQALATGGICPLPHWIFTLDYFFPCLLLVWAVTTGHCLWKHASAAILER